MKSEFFFNSIKNFTLNIYIVVNNSDDDSKEEPQPRREMSFHDHGLIWVSPGPSKD